MRERTNQFSGNAAALGKSEFRTRGPGCHDRLLAFDSTPENPYYEREPFKQFLMRRGGGEPVAYITGVKEFMGHAFQVSNTSCIGRCEGRGASSWRSPSRRPGSPPPRSPGRSPPWRIGDRAS